MFSFLSTSFLFSMLLSVWKMKNLNETFSLWYSDWKRTYISLGLQFSSSLDPVKNFWILHWKGDNNDKIEVCSRNEHRHSPRLGFLNTHMHTRLKHIEPNSCILKLLLNVNVLLWFFRNKRNLPSISFFFHNFSLRFQCIDKRMSMAGGTRSKNEERREFKGRHWEFGCDFDWICVINKPFWLGKL